ncbi:ribosomal RNA small subunit methyltransferase G [Spirochaetia bacterium]|nr:ribosomal RNA small subunit methyltransferase G [Spirochaetia bacterium]
MQHGTVDETLAAGIGILQSNFPGCLAFADETLPGRLTRYIELIERDNPALGLVGAKDRRDLVVKHILDSLAPLPLLPLPGGTAAIADVGSGAGLPGIPLAMALPECSFTLIERMGRRSGFLRSATAAMGLANAVVEEAEMEKAVPYRFDLIVFRAFHPMDKKIVKHLWRLLKPGGVLAAWKGRRENIEQEMAEAEKTLPKLTGRWSIVPVAVPLLEGERHLCLIA